MLAAVAMRYGRALVEVIAAPGSGIDPAQALDELRAISGIIADSTDLRNALLSPAVPPSRKRAIVARIVEPLAVARQVRNFLYVVIDHRRIHELTSIVEAFAAVLDQHLGYVRADVSSARELTESQQAGIAEQLSRLSGKKAKLKFTTDAELLAGVLARAGSTVYDGSARGQLERLKREVVSS